MPSPSPIHNRSNAPLDAPDSSVVLTTIAINTSDNDQVEAVQPLTASTQQVASHRQCRQIWRQPTVQRLLITTLIIVLIVLLETLVPTVGGGQGITSTVLSALARLRNATDAATAAAGTMDG